MIIVRQQRRMAFAKIENMGLIFGVIDIQWQQPAETPHIVAFGPVPGEAGLFGLQPLQVHDDLYRAVIHRAQVHDGVSGIFRATSSASQV